jgi:hypothetical protein
MEDSGSSEGPKKILQVSRSEMGKADTLKYNINYFVVDENYDKAIEEIQNYMLVKVDLPNYQEKIKPYLNHCIDLVHAIRAKRGFSKNISLTRSKQQELHETIKVHYDELQFSLKKIEQIRNQLTLEDMRSTIWIIKSTVYSIAAILLLMFLKELLNGGILDSFLIVFEHAIDEMINWFFNLLS